MEGVVEINGIELHPPIPPIVNKYESGCLIIVGCGRNIWDDLSKAQALFHNSGISYHVMAINMAFMGLEGMWRSKKITIDHFVSLHKEYFALRNIYLGDLTVTHGRHIYPNTDYVWDLNRGGTGGLFALRIALVLGYHKILICGIPLNAEGRFFDPPQQDGESGCRSIEIEFDQFKSYLDLQYHGRIRSMSGYTKKIFGEPTEEWIKGRLL